MNILVLGNTAKEHALVRWIAASEKPHKVFAYPGNPGMTDYATICCKKTKDDDICSIVDIVKKKKIDVVIPSNGALIEKGVTEELSTLGCRILGPNKQAFSLENLQCLRERAHHYGIKTLERARIVSSKEELEEALELFKNRKIALKRIEGAVRDRCDTSDSKIARWWAEEQLKTSSVLIEEFVEGLTTVASVLCDGEHYRMFPIACVYDKSQDDNEGGFSSGMGALAPLPFSRDTVKKIGGELVLKLINGLREDGIIYKGFLTLNLLLTATGDVYLLNIKTRLSDPSSLSMISLIDNDAVEEINNALLGNLEPMEFRRKTSVQYALSVVIAADGYPEQKVTEAVIKAEDVPKFLVNPSDRDASCLYFGAVSKNGDDLVTTGGRPLTLVVTAPSIERANKKAYSLLYELEDIFKGAWYRHDIGANFFVF